PGHLDRPLHRHRTGRHHRPAGVLDDSGRECGAEGRWGIVAEQIDEWLEEAMALVPDDVAARGVIHVASNEAKGLMEVAEEEGAQGIVIGARAATLMRQLRIGTVASALLHSSTVRSSSPLTAGPTSVRSLA